MWRKLLEFSTGKRTSTPRVAAIRPAPQRPACFMRSVGPATRTASAFVGEHPYHARNSINHELLEPTTRQRQFATRVAARAAIRPTPQHQTCFTWPCSAATRTVPASEQFVWGHPHSTYSTTWSGFLEFATSYCCIRPWSIAQHGNRATTRRHPPPIFPRGAPTTAVVPNSSCARNHHARHCGGTAARSANRPMTSPSAAGYWWRLPGRAVDRQPAEEDNHAGER
eukprot:GEMP01078539.1.p2 GENE.GEMP01078539.1~~GEMP01078539.1.p2  ORF type:complete len:225 (+),score=54.22 GEMP01078539.1:45-719(+)